MTTGAVPVRPEVSLERALLSALGTIDANILALGDRYPDDTTIDGVYLPRSRAGYPAGSNLGWTTSFWPGMQWLAFELTGVERYRDAALAHMEDFVARVEGGVDLDTHDLGFLYTLACVVPWRLTGATRGRDAALRAADHLMTRFLEPAGIFQAWGSFANHHERGRTIIDSLMNMPLLYWASEETGDQRYRQAAVRHVVQLSHHIIRPDDTTFHTFYWEPTTGEPLRGATQQGHADDSCWARGQAWGIYGFALNHRHTGDGSFLTAAVRCADYFLDHLPADGVAYWDLVFGDGSGQPRDSSAAAIAVCGLDELVRVLPDGDRLVRYATARDAIRESLVERYSTDRHPTSNALILHGVYDKPKGVGVDEGTLWGDYFYLEAIARALKPRWEPYW
jgi:unsaturated chondroitin disaccharide hydrolase